MRFIQILTASLTVGQDFNFGTAGTYCDPAIQLDSGNNLVRGLLPLVGVGARFGLPDRPAGDRSSRHQAHAPVKPGEASYHHVSAGTWW
jgi:hypothetical protein